MKAQKNVSTGHLDCCGEMIRRGDIVVSLNGFGLVIWVCRKWWILHPGGRMEALNKYPAAELRRWDNRRDNARGNRKGQESIVPGQQIIVPNIVPPIIPCVLPGGPVHYIKNGTMGQ